MNNKIAFKLPDQEKKDFWNLCQNQGYIPSSVIRELVRQYMKENSENYVAD